MLRPDYRAQGLKVLDQQCSAKADVVFEDPNTWAKLFIGDVFAAESKEFLLSQSIWNVVNCQEYGSENCHESDPDFSYLHFPIENWQDDISGHAGRQILNYLAPLFSWIDARLAARRNVLVHCLAGAHRAGTAGIAFVMYKTGASAKSAVSAVQAKRPCVDPIFDFRDLLLELEQALQDRNYETNVTPAPLPCGNSGLEGTWVYNKGQSRYRIYTSEHSDEDAVGLTPRLCFEQPLANGEVLFGFLQHTEDTESDGHVCWKASLSNGAQIKLHRDGALLVSSYSPLKAEGKWNPPRFAEKLNCI